MSNIIEPKSALVSQHTQEAADAVSGLIERNLELEEIFENLQPLLYELSVALYGDNEETITLSKLITEGVAYIKGERQ